ncbi:hypothetical protein B0A66_16560 [Flavobacterium hercynium]|uniref:Uncharacterized protein n=1 Tax=Flavobacterium hercynium TaxID=387094 RepID=A0A226H165_9FLAO|nr:hypothetical protein B0A66_16560 [Flavobacterium hercynium]
MRNYLRAKTLRRKGFSSILLLYVLFKIKICEFVAKKKIIPMLEGFLIAKNAKLFARKDAKAQRLFYNLIIVCVIQNRNS